MIRRSGALASIALVLLAWMLSNWLELAPRLLLPTPWDVLGAGWAEAKGGRFIDDISVSLLRLSAGFAIGAITGVLAGIALGWLTLARQALLPVVEVLRPIPPLAWIPLSIIWFGIGEPSKLFLIALTGFFPIAISTFRGVQGIEPVLIRAAQSMDIGRWMVMPRVILPACMPDITTGLRVGWTLSIAALVGAEMIAARSGVGFMIMDAMNNGRFDTVIFGILLLGLFSVSTDYLFSSLLIGRVLRWHAGIEMA